MSSPSGQHDHLTEADLGRGAGLPGFAPLGAARVGAELRLVRERLGWRLPDLAAELRIREPFLDAIEQGNLEALPGPTYQVGFIRAYAQALGLDGEEILRRFRAEGAGAARKPELSFLAPVPDRAVPTGALVLVGAVLLLAGYGFWFLHSEKDRKLAAAVPAVPAELAPLALPPVKPLTPPASGAPAKTAAPAAPAKAANPAPAGTPAPATATAATAATSPPASAPAAATAPGLAAGKTILATAASWVQVKDASGAILFSRVMQPGDRWPVPDLPGLLLTAGNAGGTEISENGSAGPPLGSIGSVLRNYALTPVAAPRTSP